MCSQWSWYPRLISTPEVESLSDAYSLEEMNEGLVIRWEPGYEKKFGYFSTVIEFLQFFSQTPEDRRCFHEIFTGVMKPCFDIDLKAEEGATEQDAREILEQLISGLVEESARLGFEVDLENDLVVLTSHAPPRKWSYHLVLNTFCLPGPRDCGALTRRVIQHLDEHLQKFVDPIASPNKSIRTLGSCKTGEPDRMVKWQDSCWWQGQEWILRPPQGRNLKTQFRDQMERSLASWTEGLECCSPLVQTKAYTGTTTVSDDLADAAIRALADNAGIPLEDPSFPYSFRDIRGNCVSLNRLRPTTCPICLRQHESDNIFLRISGVQRRVDYVCHRALQSRKQGERKVTTLCVTESVTPYLMNKDRGRTSANGRLKASRKEPRIILEDQKPVVRKTRKPSRPKLSKPPLDPEDLEECLRESRSTQTNQKDQKDQKKPKKEIPPMPSNSIKFNMRKAHH